MCCKVDNESELTLDNLIRALGETLCTFNWEKEIFYVYRAIKAQTTPENGSEWAQKPDGFYDVEDDGESYRLQLIWSLTVCIFGDYGVSPRVGWIERKEDALRFLRKLMLGWNVLDDESDEDYEPWNKD